MTTSRMSAVPLSPYRPKRETSGKLIFISCEGAVTEWEYFGEIVNSVFGNVRSKVRVINVLEDALNKKAKSRTPDEQRQVSSGDPKSLLNKMNDYREQHKDEFDFENHPDDEFWLVMDIDDHTNKFIISKDKKSNFQKWEEVISECKKRGYKYAVSNPFFELWLLLHYDDVRLDSTDNKNDSQWAVTDTHSYKPTDHFKTRLEELGVPLEGRGRKKIREKDYTKYTKERILSAICRAKSLDTTPPCGYPNNLGTTVYRLLEQIAKIDAQY